MLQLQKLSKAFGSVVVADAIALDIPPDGAVGIIGPNGAGKSTLFNLIGGQLVPDAGTVTYDGERIDRLPPHRGAARGSGGVFQAARVFRGMTALENVMVGAHAATRVG